MNSKEGSSSKESHKISDKGMPLEATMSSMRKVCVSHSMAVRAVIIIMNGGSKPKKIERK